MHGREVGQLKVGDLAQRAPLRLGSLIVHPGTRTLTGPTGSAVLRPQVMLVFMALADGKGEVVTRDELTDRAWSLRFVAEDSLNGAISEIRRALRSAGADDVELITIPKTGYRFAALDHEAGAEAEADDRTPPACATLLNRRWVLGIAGASVLSGAAVWQWPRASKEREIRAHIEQGLIALRQGLPDPRSQGVEAFRQALRLEPDNAKALGLLALSLKSAAEYGPPELVAPTRVEAEATARRALSIEPGQGDALTALALLEPSFGRWSEAEQRLRAILAKAPENEFAVQGLATLLMSTGQVRACLERLDWLNARHPLSPNLQFRRVYTLWSVGRLAEADATADRALQQWPEHPAVWFARLWTFAFTGRADRAQRMLANATARPDMPAPVAGLLGLSLAALAEPNAPLKARAIAANVAAATRGPGPAISAIMVLSALGAGVQSLDVARGFLLQQGDVLVRQAHTPLQPSVTDQHHRMTMMLWIPVNATLRREPGFTELCDRLGLSAYWRGKRIVPDYLRAT